MNVAAEAAAAQPRTTRSAIRAEEEAIVVAEMELGAFGSEGMELVWRIGRSLLAMDGYLSQVNGLHD